MARWKRAPRGERFQRAQSAKQSGIEWCREVRGSSGFRVRITTNSPQFDAAIESSGARIKRNTPVSPNLRAHVERFIQSLKQECLDKFVIVGERHLNHVNREWRLHYNRERPHEARGHLPPAIEKPPEANETVRLNDVVYSSRLGGLLKHYERRAA